MTDSILSNDRECFVCHTTQNLHRHHCFYGAGRRQTSEREGCWCWLCAHHHNMSNDGVHFDRGLDRKIKEMCEEAWLEENDATIDDFIRVFGRNYL